MMEILTFFVLYYHVLFVCSAVVMGFDYILDINLFKDLREFLDKPVSTAYIVIEGLIAIAAIFAYFLNSTVIFSALWIITVILLVSVLISVLMYGLHKLLDMEW